MQAQTDSELALRRIQRTRRWQVFPAEKKAFLTPKYDVVDEDGATIAIRLSLQNATAIARSHNEMISSIRLLTGLVISSNIAINHIHNKIKGIRDEIESKQSGCHSRVDPHADLYGDCFTD